MSLWFEKFSGLKTICTMYDTTYERSRNSSRSGSSSRMRQSYADLTYSTPFSFHLIQTLFTFAVENFVNKLIKPHIICSYLEIQQHPYVVRHANTLQILFTIISKKSHIFWCLRIEIYIMYILYYFA